MQKPLLLALVTLMLAGCGVSSLNAPVVTKAAKVKATSAQGIRDGVLALRKQRFQRLDWKIMDGALTPDEVEDSALVIPGIITGFGDYDADHDGRITLDEFLREDVIQNWIDAVTPKLEDQFYSMDLNHDGYLKGTERKSLNLFFMLYPELHGGDLNEDGGVTQSEYEDAYMAVLPSMQPARNAAPKRTALPVIVIN